MMHLAEAFLTLVLATSLTPSAGDMPPASPAPRTIGRLGYVAPRAKEPLTQPVVDRYADAIQQRFAQAVSVSTVSVGGTKLAARTLCRLRDLSGFVEPHVAWRVTDTLVVADAVLVIRDCKGELFYQGTGAAAETRDDSVPAQTQADALEDKATTALLRKFQAFRQASGPAWDLLLRTGSFKDAP